MNKIERALLERGKKILVEYAAEELEKYKKNLDEKAGKVLFDLFNSGILLDVNKIKRDGIEHLQKRLKNPRKNP